MTSVNYDQNVLNSARIDQKARSILTFLQSEPITIVDCFKVIKQMEAILRKHPLFEKENVD